MLRCRLSWRRCQGSASLCSRSRICVVTPAMVNACAAASPAAPPPTTIAPSNIAGLPAPDGETSVSALIRIFVVAIMPSSGTTMYPMYAARRPKGIGACCKAPRHCVADFASAG
ncbi:exported hypothetical protein [Mesorhizobium sp. ORS 3359]|nr:exported hypothetical protein [Mesorhizobium sp. ORS 3359]